MSDNTPEDRPKPGADVRPQAGPEAEPNDRLAALQVRLGHRFDNPELLVEALTHSSYSNVATQRGEVSRDNQRLEFLGDAVLDLLVGERLFFADPLAPPGTLTQRRIALVAERRVSRLGAELELASHLRVGPGEARAGVAEQTSTLADTFEAVLGAVYLDGGLPAAARVVDALLGAELAQREAPDQLKSKKALLQEHTQGETAFTPRYRLLGSEPEFEVEVCYGPRLTETGRGPTRRAAEEAAADRALAALLAQPTAPKPRRPRAPRPGASPENKR